MQDFYPRDCLGAFVVISSSSHHCSTRIYYNRPSLIGRKDILYSYCHLSTEKAAFLAYWESIVSLMKLPQIWFSTSKIKTERRILEQRPIQHPKQLGKQVS